MGMNWIDLAHDTDRWRVGVFLLAEDLFASEGPCCTELN
jgi:hypothetical protein